MDLGEVGGGILDFGDRGDFGANFWAGDNAAHGGHFVDGGGGGHFVDGGGGCDGGGGGGGDGGGGGGGGCD